MVFIGTSTEALACVRFGLITEETDLEELIALVYTTGKEVEESSKVSILQMIIYSNHWVFFCKIETF